jgi:hypothetical protein
MAEAIDDTSKIELELKKEYDKLLEEEQRLFKV